MCSTIATKLRSQLKHIEYGVGCSAHTSLTVREKKEIICAGSEYGLIIEIHGKTHTHIRCDGSVFSVSLLFFLFNFDERSGMSGNRIELGRYDVQMDELVTGECGGNDGSSPAAATTSLINAYLSVGRSRPKGK